MKNKKILFIGVSSFTGYGFVKKILKNKFFEVHCTLTKKLKDYEYIKKKRIKIIGSFLSKSLKQIKRSCSYPDLKNL